MNAWIMRTAMAALFSGLVPGAMAQVSTNVVAKMNDWSVFEYPPICGNEKEGEECRQLNETPAECWGVTTPKNMVITRDGHPVSEQRGDIMLFVTFRPNQQGEISFTGGYPFASGSTIEMDVDGAIFKLFSEGDWAWPVTREDDAKILEAMKNGSSAVLTAKSGSGTQTHDTFSLLGFTNAMGEASRRCY